MFRNQSQALFFFALKQASTSGGHVQGLMLNWMCRKGVQLGQLIPPPTRSQWAGLEWCCKEAQDHYTPSALVSGKCSPSVCLYGFIPGSWMLWGTHHFPHQWWVLVEDIALEIMCPLQTLSLICIGLAATYALYLENPAVCMQYCPHGPIWTNQSSGYWQLRNTCGT